ncbi:hypothetical protein HQ535_08345 [bacterium]|nr:hypothetical protein [bacterium]
MTTAPYAVRTPDWKLTEGRRVLMVIGWGALMLSAYVVFAAIVLGVPGAWFMAAVPAAVALVVSALLPSPVPADLLSERRNRVDFGLGKSPN